MKTELLPASLDSSLKLALQLLLAGQVIALPTDTVYGVAADGFDPGAIERLFLVKDRPRDKAIPLLLADAADLDLVAASIPDAAHLLAGQYWPGPLTLVVTARPDVPAVLRADGATVAVRIPDHPVPRALARALGHPLAATSANISGRPDPTTAPEVLAQLSGRVPLVLDGGPVAHGVPSTVVDVSTRPLRVIRVGALSPDEIEKALRHLSQGMG